MVLEMKMLNGLMLAAICGCFGSVASGVLVIESHPRRPQVTDHVILRCYASPATFYFRLDCQLEWDWTPKEPPQPPADERGNSQLTSAPVTPWWKVSNQDVSDSGSVVVISEMKPEYQGCYVCRLSCVGRKTESAALTLEIGEDSAQEINAQNAKIAYIASGAIFGIIILATVLRFCCVNARKCCCLLRDNMCNSVNSPRNRLDWHPHYGFWSTDTTWFKPSSDRRSTILDKNVWLPPYEAAMKYPLLVRPSSGPAKAVGRPPTYEEALVALVQQPRNNTDRMQMV